MSQLYHILARQAGKTPEHVAIVEEDVRWSYAELKEKIDRLASTLASQGIKSGDRVALMMLNQKEYLLSFFAILRLGAVVVPVNIQLPPEDIFYVLQNSGTRLVITTERFAMHFAGKPLPILVANQENQDNPQFPSLEAAVETGRPDFQPESPDRKPDELALLMYTSGTTSKPKGVMLTEENLIKNMEGFDEALKFEPENERILLALPKFHAYGLIIALYAISISATLVLVPTFAPRKLMAALAEEHVTILPLVPTMFSLLAESIRKVGVEPFKSLKYCVSGGASLPAALLKQLESALNIIVLEGYGLTETSPVLSVNRPERGSIPGSVGLPLSNVEIKLVDDEGNTLPWEPGAESGVGEILAKGPNVMQGYYNLPEENEKAFDKDGWFRTGDLGHFDAEGNLYISGGRKKDLIIKAGENLSPLRIEQVLYAHPAVQDASVIGVPDEKLGEEIMACVQLRPDHSADAAELKKHCRDHLPPFMIPGYFRFYDELPKNGTGKILKTKLREDNCPQSAPQ